jgi:hypothetical protein
LLIAVALLTPPAMSAAAEKATPFEGFEEWKPEAKGLPSGWKLVELGRKGRLRLTTSRSKAPHAGEGALRIASGNPQRFKAPGFVVKDIVGVPYLPGWEAQTGSRLGILDAIHKFWRGTLAKEFL